MSETTSNATASTPNPVVPSNITFLNEALLPFRESFYGTALIIKFFYDLVCYIGYFIEVEKEHGKPQTNWIDFHRWWEDYVIYLRYEGNRGSLDRESFEVARFLGEMRDRKAIWKTLDFHIRLTVLGGAAASLWEDMGSSYHNVPRGTKWLVECALVGLSASNISPDVQRVALQNLKALAVCRPKYNWRPSANPSLGAPVPDLFGPGGILWLVMEKFTRDPNDSVGIRVLLRILLEVVDTVVRLWTFAHQMEESSTEGMPSFKWYICGLTQASSAFREEVEDQDPNTQYRFYIRDGLKDVDFDFLWDYLWKLAIEIYHRPGQRDERQFFIEMTDFIIGLAQDPASDPRPWMPGGQNVQGIIAQIQSETGAAADFAGRHYDRAQRYTDLDLQGIYRGPHLLPSQYDWGGRFYTDRDFWDRENEDEDRYFDGELEVGVDNSDELEAFGPFIELETFAELVTGGPSEQCCTVCQERLEDDLDDDEVVMRLHVCGHYFHHGCLWRWANGILPNSNLCPECRSEFSAVRRAVRVKAGVVGSTEPTAEDNPGDNGAEENVLSGTEQTDTFGTDSNHTIDATTIGRTLNDYFDDQEENGLAEDGEYLALEYGTSEGELQSDRESDREGFGYGASDEEYEEDKDCYQ
ncbi:hypothetical protein NX059_011852 [Plenodomus lindquistii]|nr:hypothetical protein NX059_011852 [Plenodomus lindquistii]